MPNGSVSGREPVGVGVPDDVHPAVVNVDCSDYFMQLDPNKQPSFGKFCHSWHIGNRVFARDLAYVLHGGIDRHAIPTRHRDGSVLALKDAERPAHEALWLDG